VTAPPADRFTTTATRPRPTRAQRVVAFMFLSAFAATIATVIMTGLWVRSPGARAVPDNPAATLVQGEPHTVNLAFESRTALEDIEFTVDLPAGIELADRPGLRRVAWKTRLAAGNNLLPLTIVARGGRGGQLAARVRQGDELKTFVVDVTVGPR